MPGRLRADAQALDVGILDRELALQVGDGAGDLVGLELEHQSLGILDG